MLNPQKLLAVFIAASLSFTFTACGDAKTTLIEKKTITGEGDHDDKSLGRLVITNSTPEAVVYDLQNKRLLESFALTSAPSAVIATAGYRYAALVDRSGDAVTFLDGGLWQEDHVDHLHDHQEAPQIVAEPLTGSRPTHVIEHEGQLAVFFDGDAATATPASVAVFNDADLAAKRAPVTLPFAINMHGVAEPRGEHLLTSWRRADALSTSANPVLPDQVAVYHNHDGVYQQEQILDVSCPDLHGAAQNEDFIVFGCADGVLVVTSQGSAYSAKKLANPQGLAEGLRIGSLYGNVDSSTFIGVASGHGGSVQQWFTLDPSADSISPLDWQPLPNAVPVARGFSFSGEQFLILDSQGYLTALEPLTENGQTRWQFGARLDISQADVANLPEDVNFTLAVAQNGHTVYIADPIDQQVLIVDLDLMMIVDKISLDFTPTAIAWLGIAEVHTH